jgi:hypothetical protein
MGDAMGYRAAVLIKGRSPKLHDSSFVLASIDEHIFGVGGQVPGLNGTNLEFTGED